MLRGRAVKLINLSLIYLTEHFCPHSPCTPKLCHSLMVVMAQPRALGTVMFCFWGQKVSEVAFSWGLKHSSQKQMFSHKLPVSKPEVAGGCCPPPHSSAAPPSLSPLPSFSSFSYNIFKEIQFTYHKIHLIKVLFSVVTSCATITTNSRMLHYPQKKPCTC